MYEHHQIIAAIVNGDRKAFIQLYELFSAQVYNLAISYAQNERDAEEITQDVFVKIHKYAQNFKGNSSVRTWVYRITVNTALNHIKPKKRRMTTALLSPKMITPDFEHPGVLLERKEDSKALFSVIQTLPHNQKTAFILSFIEDLPRKEVANIMELSLKATESLLQRAKSNLRTRLNPHYPNRKK